MGRTILAMGEREIREKTAEIEARLLDDIDRKWTPLANRCIADAEREYQWMLEFVRDGGEIGVTTHYLADNGNRR